MSDWCGARVLVTGATGFVGGALARRLLTHGAQVTVLARSAQKAAPLAELGAAIVPGDLIDAASVRRAAEGVEVVFHVAALMGGPLKAQQAANIGGTRHVVDAAAEARARRFVHVSTIAVYGNVLPPRVTEDTPRGFGASPYGITKAAGEDVVRDAVEGRPMEAVILRPGMVFGPGSGMWTSNFFRLAQLRPTPFFGDGSTPVPAIYIADLVDLMLTAGVHPGADRQTFNAVMDPPPRWREYMRALMRLTSHDDWLNVPPVVGRIAAGLMLLVAPRYSVLRDTPDMIEQIVGRTIISAEKARQLLGWQAQISPAEGAALSAGWLRELGLLK